jgi:hypothetical protein
MVIPEDIRQQSILYYVFHMYFIIYCICIKIIHITCYVMYILNQIITNISNNNYVVWDDF